MKRLSVVITNYNYARYVAEAIQSALDLDWDDVEIVVVDDGSTDGSREVIDAFATAVTRIYSSNAGQRAAANRGFAATSGDVVLFLDADDVLPRKLPTMVASRWSPEVSKWQFRMQRMDAQGLDRGTPFPSLKASVPPERLRRWLTNASAYPTPPGSGNAYSRWFLEAVMPVGAEAGDAADSALLVAAPLLGDVVVVPEVVVRYRRHDTNDSDLLNTEGQRFAREVARAGARWRYARALPGVRAKGFTIPESALRRSRELLQLRVAAWRLGQTAEGAASDSAKRLVIDIFRSPLPPGPESAVRRASIAAWCSLMVIAPRGLVPWLLRLRFSR